MARSSSSANGDVYDSPLMKPYHGVSWLENKGPERPFVRHAIGAVYGATARWAEISTAMAIWTSWPPASWANRITARCERRSEPTP